MVELTYKIPLNRASSKWKIEPIKILPITEKFCKICGTLNKRVLIKEFNIGTGKKMLKKINYMICENKHDKVISHICVCDCGSTKRGCHGWFGCGNCSETCQLCGESFCTNY